MRVPQCRSSKTVLCAHLKAAWIGVCILCTGIIGPSVAGPSEQAAEAQASINEHLATIRVNTNLVTVPVSVTDSGGHPVENLDLQDFLIEEDGRPETAFRMHQAGQSPLRLALLFDLSGSLNSRFGFEQLAATRFLEKVHKPGDTVSIIAFSESPRLLLEMSDSVSNALHTLLRLEPTESPTAFFDSVMLAASVLRQAAGLETRQAAIAISDGEDNRSKHDLSEALHEAQRSDVIFYSINPGGPSIRLNEISLKGQSDLTLLAKETGGNAFVSDKAGDLDAIFSRIAAELRAQYLLSYYSTNSNADGKYRKISVSIPQRPDLRIRTRRGYYAAEK